MPTPTSPAGPPPDPVALVADLRRWGAELGFQQVGVAGTALPEAERRLAAWLAAGYHGEMDWMAAHGSKRSRPAELVPGTLRVICARFDYWPADASAAAGVLADPARAYLARYSLGRDYHKVLRGRLRTLAARLAAVAGPAGYRVFVDSAPVLEKPLAAAAGLGWIGKHTNLINAEAGSWFLLGEIFTDLPLPLDAPATDHCGSCARCLDACPTGAIVAPYVLDARRCIAYLTIELAGPIPVEFRAPMGNRVFGCDDCQLACPWNKFARPTGCGDFAPRHGLDAAALATLFGWSEAEWSRRTEGSAIRRAGYLGWLRNLAVGLGNAPRGDPAVVAALQARASHPSELVREHVAWALARHGAA
jgi:epoxyqueuosine reductase